VTVHAALRVPAVLAALAVVTAAAGLTGTGSGTGVTTGVVSAVVADSPDGSATVAYALDTPYGPIPMDIVSAPGSTLTVTGTPSRVSAASVLAAGFPSQGGPPPAGAKIVHTVDIAVAVPSDVTMAAADVTAMSATLVSMVSGPVSRYWSAVTGQRVVVKVGTVVTYASAHSTADVCANGSGAMAIEAVAQGLSHVHPAVHTLVAAPGTRCWFAGRASLSYSGPTTAGGTILLAAGHTLYLSVITHELGHNFGLMHADVASCFTAPSVPD
jgi:hypothetical protein